MSNKLIDLSGMKFGLLTIIERAGSNSRKQPLWLASCECGNDLVVEGSGLRRGHTTNCGCNTKEKLRKANQKDISNQRFGYLTVIKRESNISTKWICRCECGNEKVIDGKHLRSGNTKSCGCKKKELLSQSRTLDIHNQRFGRLTALQYKARGKWLCKCDCGNETIQDSTSLRIGRVVSCGCYSAEQASIRCSEKRGALNPSWNPNLSDEDRQKNRMSPEDLDWKKTIYKRDDYRCNICSDNKNLNAHHLNGWAEYPLERYLAENGITLCRNCHNEFHSQYGKTSITRDTYINWRNLKLNI